VTFYVAAERGKDKNWKGREEGKDNVCINPPSLGGVAITVACQSTLIRSAAMIILILVAITIEITCPNIIFLGLRFRQIMI
jgi:hypothetical protein